MTQLLKKLSDTIKKQDKNVMISFITACVFSLFGILQLIFVISTSLARTFDHISLILVDFIIAAICIVYVLYRKGKLGKKRQKQIKERILHLPIFQESASQAKNWGTTHGVSLLPPASDRQKKRPVVPRKTKTFSHRVTGILTNPFSAVSPPFPAAMCRPEVLNSAADTQADNICPTVYCMRC